jgi:hypothetical protein
MMDIITLKDEKKKKDWFQLPKKATFANEKMESQF